MGDAHRHDFYAEQLSDGELAVFIKAHKYSVWEAQHDLQRRQFRLDRLTREKKRREECTGD